MRGFTIGYESLVVASISCLDENNFNIQILRTTSNKFNIEMWKYNPNFG